jgi:hypothetical protein
LFSYASPLTWLRLAPCIVTPTPHFNSGTPAPLSYASFPVSLCLIHNFCYALPLNLAQVCFADNSTPHPPPPHSTIKLHLDPNLVVLHDKLSYNSTLIWLCLTSNLATPHPIYLVKPMIYYDGMCMNVYNEEK